MDELKVTGVKAALTAAAAALTAVWGWFGWLVTVWVALMLLDFTVGMGAAACKGTWSSRALREGALHKGGMMLVFVVASAADWLIGTILANAPGLTLPFDYTVMFAPLAAIWYIIGELGSLLEHAVSFGAAVPPWLSRILEISREAIDTAGDKLVGETTETASSESAGDGSGNTKN